MVRWLYLIGGFVSMGLGTLGIFVPLLPTVAFYLLAVFCFARSNPALAQKLLDDPRFGPSLRLWRERGAIGRRGKWAATTAFVVSSALGMALLRFPMSLVPLGVALIIGTWIWTRPES
jgi:uncharacterized membrane protein YbaN (DUF454 family)